MLNSDTLKKGQAVRLGDLADTYLKGQGETRVYDSYETLTGVVGVVVSVSSYLIGVKLWSTDVIQIPAEYLEKP